MSIADTPFVSPYAVLPSREAQPRTGANLSAAQYQVLGRVADVLGILDGRRGQRTLIVSQPASAELPARTILILPFGMGRANKVTAPAERPGVWQVVEQDVQGGTRSSVRVSRDNVAGSPVYSFGVKDPESGRGRPAVPAEIDRAIGHLGLVAQAREANPEAFAQQMGLHSREGNDSSWLQAMTRRLAEVVFGMHAPVA